MFLKKNIREITTSEVKYLPALSLNDRIGAFSVIFRWSNGVWRLLLKECLVFLVLYVIISVILITVNSELSMKMLKYFHYVQTINNWLPLQFLLGFFVTTILNRWWQTILEVPFMTQPAFLIQSYLNSPTECITDHMTSIKEQTKVFRNIRLTIMRFMNLAWIFKVSELSKEVKRRFKPHFCLLDPKEGKVHCGCFKQSDRMKKCEHKPDIFSTVDMHPTHCVRHRLEAINADSVVKKYFKPLITAQEMKVIEHMEIDYHESHPEGKYKPDMWIPLMWASRVLNHAHEVKLFRDDRHFVELVNMLGRFRGSLGVLSLYNEFNMPLGYTQVVVVAVYTYFMCEVFARQYVGQGPGSTFMPQSTNVTVDGWSDQVGMVFPIFSLLKFLFYMGWYKVGVSLLSPLRGEKGDQFPMSEILDYNLQISTLLAPADDNMYPEYMQSKSGTAAEQIQLLNNLSKVKMETPSAIGNSLVESSFFITREHSLLREDRKNTMT